MDPASITDTSSAWSNLWLISSVIFALAWMTAISLATAAAAGMPYLLTRMLLRYANARRAAREERQPRRPRREAAVLLLAAAAVIAAMTGTVTGLGYGAKVASDINLAGRLNQPDPVRAAAEHLEERNSEVARRMAAQAYDDPAQAEEAARHIQLRMDGTMFPYKCSGSRKAPPRGQDATVTCTTRIQIYEPINIDLQARTLVKFSTENRRFLPETRVTGTFTRITALKMDNEIRPTPEKPRQDP